MMNKSKTSLSDEQRARVELADRHTRRMSILLAAENWAGAKRLLQDAIAELQDNPLRLPVAEIPIEALNMPERYTSLLRDTMLCETVGDLHNWSVTAMLATENIGPKTVETLLFAMIDLAERRGALTD